MDALESAILKSYGKHNGSWVRRNGLGSGVSDLDPLDLSSSYTLEPLLEGVGLVALSEARGAVVVYRDASHKYPRYTRNCVSLWLCQVENEYIVFFS